MSARQRKRLRATLKTPAAPTPSAPQPTVHGPLEYLAVSALLLIPCFWQARLQAGDLGSHIYNAWLAQLIRQGQAPGLAIVPQFTNVLFDVLLGALFRALGAAAAERIAVSLAVMVFVWGAFALASAAGRHPWPMLPAIAMLAYGWVFHMGFFNFYLSLGLCFWALALAWRWQPRRLSAAAVLLALAYVAHGLAVAWAVAMLAYLWLMRRQPKWGLSAGRLFAAALAAMILTHIAMSLSMMTHWTWEQIERSAGVDQVWVFGDKYLAVSVGLLLLWALPFAALVRRESARKVLSSEPFHLCALTAAGIVLIPSWAWIPAYYHALVFISQRLSLALAICLCAFLARAPVSAWQRYAMTALALLFFAFLYADERTINAFEDQVDVLVASLPPGQRVIGAVQTLGVQVDPLPHIFDRACIGRCYSYANYEPSSGQFRIRVVGNQSMVAPTDADASRMQIGAYVVRPRDLPLFQIEAAPDGRVYLRSLSAGGRNGYTTWTGL